MWSVVTLAVLLEPVGPLTIGLGQSVVVRFDKGGEEELVKGTEGREGGDMKRDDTDTHEGMDTRYTQAVCRVSRDKGN